LGKNNTNHDAILQNLSLPGHDMQRDLAGMRTPVLSVWATLSDVKKNCRQIYHYPMCQEDEGHNISPLVLQSLRTASQVGIKQFDFST
jgi:hypothetical protein